MADLHPRLHGRGLLTLCTLLSITTLWPLPALAHPNCREITTSDTAVGISDICLHVNITQPGAFTIAIAHAPGLTIVNLPAASTLLFPHLEDISAHGCVLRRVQGSVIFAALKSARSFLVEDVARVEARRLERVGTITSFRGEIGVAVLGLNIVPRLSVRARTTMSEPAKDGGGIYLPRLAVAGSMELVEEGSLYVSVGDRESGT